MYTVRGKRKRQSATKHGHREQYSGRGRPMKRAENLSVRKGVNSHRWLQSCYDMASPPWPQVRLLSQLELLPNELIQQIFFYCFEINLPRASPRLTQALSTESTYNILILFAYFDDDGHHPVEEKLFLPAQYIQLELNEKVALQKAILSCRWFSLGRVTYCLPILSRLQMTQAWHAEKRAEDAIYASLLEDGHDIRLPIVASHDLLQQIAPLPEPGDIESQIQHFSAKSKFVTEVDTTDQRSRYPATTETFLPRIMTWSTDRVSSGVDSETQLCKGLEAGISVIAARVLPDWLLRGSPWTQDKIELLQLFRQGLQFVQEGYVLEVSAEAVFKGMASAIKEQQYVALLTLVELHNFAFVEWPSNINSKSPPRFFHLLPPHLFHMASRAGDESSLLMWLLIRAGLGCLSKDDNILTAWALHGRARGDNVAEWLLTLMADTSISSGYGSPDVFKQGRMTSMTIPRELPVRNWTFAEELGYLRGRADVRPTNLLGHECG